MPNVLIRHLPDHVHEKLVHRAEASGKSLQRYLTDELARLAATPTLEEVLSRIDERSGGEVGLAEAVADLASARDQR